MPNTFIDNKDAWLRLSETDYIGQFVKTWLAFNAWYRSAYAAPADRAIIEEIKWNPNPVSGHLRPLLEVASEEAEQFRADIALLHHRLENHEIAAGKGAEKRRITLTRIYLRDNPPTTKHGNHYGHAFVVERQPNQQVRIEVSRSNNVRFAYLQQTYARKRVRRFWHGELPADHRVRCWKYRDLSEVQEFDCDCERAGSANPKDERPA